jgi:MFS family permease
VPGLPGILPAALAIGAGTGLVTPLGFAALATATPPERLGRTMGSAEVGRELGDAGGPLLVGGIAVATTITGGLLALAALLVCAATAVGAIRPAPEPRA